MIPGQVSMISCAGRRYAGRRAAHWKRRVALEHFGR